MSKTGLAQLLKKTHAHRAEDDAGKLGVEVRPRWKAGF